MTPSLKRIGLALALALAIGALAAATASAHEFHFETAPMIVTGEQDNTHANEFAFPFGAVECEKSHFEGTTVAQEVGELTLKPKYENCKQEANNATVTTNECDFVFTGKTDANGHSQLHIVCPAGKKIEVSIPALNCTLKIGTQTPQKGVKYTNTGAGKTRDFDATITAEGIVYEKSGGMLCQMIGGNGKEGKYVSEVTVSAYEDEESKEGPQTGTWVE
ncbi:MAG TPA: hypothetical protein VHQ43_10750 [Solirubrobacterales bacterium]|nr:hypothetical protein [Solirubrobacterales bacterium]